MRHKKSKLLGLIVAGVGVLIVLALVLPAAVWWFLLGAALIAAGIIIIRGC